MVIAFFRGPCIGQRGGGSKRELKAQQRKRYRGGVEKLTRMGPGESQEQNRRKMRRRDRRDDGKLDGRCSKLRLRDYVK